MKSKLSFLTSTLVGLMATTGVALAAGTPLPEPGSLALVGLAIGVLVVVARKGKK